MTSTTRRRFGPFEVDPTERQLRRDGRVIPVTRKAFELLGALLDRPGRLVSKADLFDRVWAGRIVTDAALSRVIHELRVALGDKADAPRFIATAHGLGFRFVAEVELAGIAEPTASTRMPGVASVAAPVFGRQAELRQLQDALQAADEGRRQVVFVTGEAGIGKTALVESFLRTPSPRADLCVAQGRCFEQYGPGEAYLPLLEALESIARHTSNEELRDTLLRFGPAWLAQLPWLAHEADPAALQRALPGATAQRMLREIAQVFEVLSANRTVVLWLEDLHWSDYSTLDALSMLAARRERARLLVIASLRPDDASAKETPPHGVLRTLRHRNQAFEIPLGFLDEAAVAAYLRARFAGPATRLPLDTIASVVRTRTGGNGLFVAAIVDDWIAGGHIIRQADGWVLNGALDSLGKDLPESVRLLLRMQIERLSDDERRLVEAAAVVGTEFSAGSVAAALDRDVAEIEERCLRLVERKRFISGRDPVGWPDGTESAGFQFTHALHWQAAHEQTGQARRAEWQRRIAERLESAYGAQRGQIAAELAIRFEAARDLPRALQYLELAGASALSRGAYSACVDRLRHALVLVERLPPDERSPRRLKLLLPLGAAMMAVQGYASDEVESIYREALALCRDVGRPEEIERVLRGQWNVALVRADLVQARVLADEMILRASGGDGAFDAFAKSGQTAMHQGEFAAALTQLERAVALASQENEAITARELPRVVAYLAWVLWYLGRPEQARRRGDEALALARSTGGVHTLAFVLGFVAWLHVFCGRTGDALALAEEQRRLASEHELGYWLAWSDTVRGLAAVETGDVDAGLSGIHDAIGRFEAMGARVGLSHFLCQLAEAELHCGQVAQAQATLGRAETLLARHRNAYHAAEIDRIRGRLAAAQGDGAAARRHVVAALETARRHEARSLELRAATDLACRLVSDGDPAAAREHIESALAAVTEGEETADQVRARALLGRIGAP